jgi:hypothetical protein
MATESISASIAVDGLKQTLRAFSQLDKDVQKAARVEVQKVADLLGREIAAAGRSRPDRRDRFVANTIRGKKDRSPQLLIGGASAMSVSRPGRPPRAGDLVFGMEFGADQNGPNAWRFPPRTPRRGRGNEGYWIFPTARKQGPRVVALWAQALDKAAADWSK